MELKANNGVWIKAYLNLPDEPGGDTGFNTNCHGATFADSKFWIDNDDAASFLYAEGYTEFNSVETPAPKDVVMYSQHDEQGLNTLVHSATVVGTRKGVLVYGQGGVQDHNSTLPVEPGPGGSWPDAAATYKYYRKR